MIVCGTSPWGKHRLLFIDSSWELATLSLLINVERFNLHNLHHHPIKPLSNLPWDLIINSVEDGSCGLFGSDWYAELCVFAYVTISVLMTGISSQLMELVSHSISQIKKLLNWVSFFLYFLNIVFCNWFLLPALITNIIQEEFFWATRSDLIRFPILMKWIVLRQKSRKQKRCWVRYSS